MDRHRLGTRYRARVQDIAGDRWSLVGTLEFLDRHCVGLTILWIKPV